MPSIIFKNFSSHFFISTSLSSISFSSIFSSILAETGEKVSSAHSDLQTQTSIISQLNTQREAVSGVSLDEEAINLMQYQKAYEAAARFIKVANEMTDTILSLAQ